MKFRELRKKNQALSETQCISILEQGTSGVLAVLGDGDYPYTVPLSYVYHESKIFVHCAPQGHKTDAIKKHDKVSFCVIAQDDVVPEEYTTYYRSVIVFGKAHILEEEAEKRRAIEILAEKYMPDDKEGSLAEIDRTFSGLCMIQIDIEHMSGKQASELI